MNSNVFTADRQMFSAYRGVVASGEQPVANEAETCYSGAEVKPARLREKVNSREQLILDAVGDVLQVGPWQSHGATQHTLKRVRPASQHRAKQSGVK